MQPTNNCIWNINCLNSVDLYKPAIEPENEVNRPHSARANPSPTTEKVSMLRRTHTLPDFSILHQYPVKSSSVLPLCKLDSPFFESKIIALDEIDPITQETLIASAKENFRKEMPYYVALTRDTNGIIRVWDAFSLCRSFVTYDLKTGHFINNQGFLCPLSRNEFTELSIFELNKHTTMAKSLCDLVKDKKMVDIDEHTALTLHLLFACTSNYHGIRSDIPQHYHQNKVGQLLHGKSPEEKQKSIFWHQIASENGNFLSTYVLAVQHEINHLRIIHSKKLDCVIHLLKKAKDQLKSDPLQSHKPQMHRPIDKFLEEITNKR